MTEQERCEAEMREAESLLRRGHPDVEGLCLALADWAAERKLLSAVSEPVGGAATITTPRNLADGPPWHHR